MKKIILTLISIFLVCTLFSCDSGVVKQKKQLKQYIVTNGELNEESEYSIGFNVHGSNCSLVYNAESGSIEFYMSTAHPDKVFMVFSSLHIPIDSDSLNFTTIMTDLSENDLDAFSVSASFNSASYNSTKDTIQIIEYDLPTSDENVAKSLAISSIDMTLMCLDYALDNIGFDISQLGFSDDYAVYADLKQSLTLQGGSDDE